MFLNILHVKPLLKTRYVHSNSNSEFSEVLSSVNLRIVHTQIRQVENRKLKDRTNFLKFVAVKAPSFSSKLFYRER